MKAIDEALDIWKDKKKRKIFLIVLFAIVLVIACYFVFFSKEKTENTAVEMSETETKLCSVLSDIEGVGKISAYVSEDGEGNTIGVVLIVEGADSLSVRLDLMKAAALALGIEQKDVQIYKMTN